MGDISGMIDRELVLFASPAPLPTSGMGIYRKSYGTGGFIALLDQLFASKDYRNMHIGSELLRMCASAAKNMGAKKLYLCAGSSEDTIHFYKKNGCVPVEEPDRTLMEEDPNDIQLELQI